MCSLTLYRLDIKNALRIKNKTKVSRKKKLQFEKKSKLLAYTMPCLHVTIH